MKLISKEMCPVTVRDRLVKNLGGQDAAVCDLVKAVEWAEAECLRLNKENAQLKVNLLGDQLVKNHLKLTGQ